MINFKSKEIEEINVNEKITISIKELTLDSIFSFIKKDKNKVKTYYLDVIINGDKVDFESLTQNTASVNLLHIQHIYTIISKVIEKRLSQYNPFQFLFTSEQNAKKFEKDLQDFKKFNTDVQRYPQPTSDAPEIWVLYIRK